MSSTVSPTDVQAHSHAHHEEEDNSLWSWITTVDHKRIGKLYMFSSMLFFLVGGVEALAIRLQLAFPRIAFISAQTYNEMFTMHATTMIFLAAMPMAAAFFNFLIPLQIGARDVVFPRLNAFSYWLYLFGAIFINVSFFVGAFPDGGWFGYSNLTGAKYSPGLSIDFWALGLLILGNASLTAGFDRARSRAAFFSRRAMRLGHGASEACATSRARSGRRSLCSRCLASDSWARMWPGDALQTRRHS